MSGRPRKRVALPSLVQLLVLVAIAALVAFFLIALPNLVYQAGRRSRIAARPTPQPVPSGYFQLTDREWSGLTFTRVRLVGFPNEDRTEGTIVQADDTTSQVLSPYTGRVTKVYATVGDTVVKGRPLFAIEGGEYAQAQNDLLTGIQTLHSARVQLAVTARDRARLLKLQPLGGAARKDVEQRGADLAAAEVAVRNDEIAIELVRSRLRALDFSDAAIDRLANSDARVIGDHVVVPAPISGTVTQRTVGVGSELQSAETGGSSPLLTITDFSRVFFAAAVTEASIANVHVGDAMAVRMVAFPERTFRAYVRYIAPTVDPATHRIFVRAEVDNPGGDLRPGMFGTMAIETAQPTTTVAVPEDAVVHEEDDARVWVVGPNKTLALRYVRAGDTVDGMVEVTGGLRPGDSVATSGAIFIDRALLGSD